MKNEVDKLKCNSKIQLMLFTTRRIALILH